MTYCNDQDIVKYKILSLLIVYKNVFLNSNNPPSTAAQLGR